MHNSKTLFNDFINRIRLPETDEEIKSMAELVLENVFGLSRTDIMAGKLLEISPEKEQRLSEILIRLNNYEPVQYILGEAEFFGRKFLVNRNVLIPRPETEELIVVIKEFAKSKSGLRILDVGTGSGCIPITLALEVPYAAVWATDVSTDALEVARQNARNLNASVSFLNHDILRDEIPLTDMDIVVSNPPYITILEMDAMKGNVVAFEPHLALFVPNDDPLLFYKAIARKSSQVLSPSGLLAVEINEKFGNEVGDLFAGTGFSNIEIVKDINGKNRIVKGIKAR